MNFPTACAHVFQFVTKKLPRKNIIIFESIPAFSDNTYWFYRYLTQNERICKQYKFVWAVRSKEDYRKELLGRKITCIIKTTDDYKEKLRFAYYSNFAKFIFDCNDYIRKKNPQQTRVYLGHGMAVKIAAQYISEQGETDLNTLTSSLFFPMYDAFDFPPATLSNIGYCRTDILYQHRGKRENRDTTQIIWMPTYRQHKGARGIKMENHFPLGLPLIKTPEQMEQVNRALQNNNTVLYIRPHPSQDIRVMHVEQMSNIKIANDEFLKEKGLQLYEFLTETDALITDYSSVYYDYLILDRPIALTIEDLEAFKRKWTLFFSDFKQNYHCVYPETVEELIQFIREVSADEDPHEKDREAERTRFYDYLDGRTCERLYTYMAEKYGL